jgi:YD repeat-containing protein
MSTKIKCSRKYTIKLMKMGFGKENGEEILESESFYDEKGNLTRELKYDDETGVCEENVFDFDHSGNIIKHFMQVEMDEISETFTFDRDEKGRLRCELKLYGDDPGEKVEIEYEAHDNPVKIKRFDSDGIPEIEELFKYDSSDRLLEHNKKLLTEEAVEIAKIKYNDNGEPVQKTVFDGDEKIVSDTTFEYDPKGRLIRETEKDDQGTIISDISTAYNEKDYVTERKISGFQSRTLLFEYDDHDNCTEEAVLDENGNLVMKTTFEFNEHSFPISESRMFSDHSRQTASNSSRYQYEYYD